MTSRVLVLDGSTTQALACVRALGRAGHVVFVAGVERRPLAAWSRHCRARFRLADETLTAFAALRTWAQQHGVQVVLPQTERSCILCNLQREGWEALGIAVGCGPHDLLLRAFDKALTLELAEACGVRVPPRRVPTSLADGLAAAAALGYPVVVKPRFSHFWEGGRFVSGDGSGYARDRTELEAQMRACRQDRFWPLIQGFVPGRGKGVFALYDHGTPLAWFAHERLRDVRPSGSGSSLRRSIALDPRLQVPAARLLAAWAWHGPAMVEFRDDGESEPCLIEVNGRFWGSLDLAVQSGVDFPTLWVRLLRGEPVDPPAGYETGVTSRWLWGDVKRMLNILKGRPPGYPEPYPTVLEGLREVLGPQPPGTRSETWNADDRWPALGEWVQGIAGLVRPARPRPRRRPAAVAQATTAPPVGGQADPVRVLMITSGWPQPGQPQTTHFIKRQAEFLRAAGVHVDVFHFRGERRPWNYALAWLRARRRLAFGRYDLVHAQFGQSGLLALPKRVPLVVTYRGSDILGIVGQGGRYTRAGRILQRLTRMVATQADAVIVVSEHMKRHLPASVPATVLPSGLDLTLFRPVPRDAARARLGLPLDRRLVLFAGNPAVPRKRYELAKRAIELLNPSLPVELIVAWGVPHADMPYLMSACDAMVFTSMQEGSPNVVKEALACDLPVVSVHVGDVAERLGGIDGCELCPDERPETIAASLARVLERRQRIAGRATVIHLDENTLTARLIALYHSVLQRSPRGTHAPLTQQVQNVG
jgi:teichuronic acid biosynthesis glycosyltransferase TuaC